MALSVSISTLYRWRTQGLLVAGRHWMRKWPSPKSPVLYHCERVQERMAELTSRSAEQVEPAWAEHHSVEARTRLPPGLSPRKSSLGGNA